MPVTQETHDKIALLRDVARASRLPRFVETGSDIGNICAGLLGTFDRLITVELDHDSYRACVRRFVDEPKVLPIYGDSALVLQELGQIVDASVWFLDAHYNEGHTRGPVDCPLLDELTHIIHTHPRGHWIVVDDRHLMGEAEGYPTFDEIRKAIDPHGGVYDFDFDFGGDQILASPLLL